LTAGARTQGATGFFNNAWPDFGPRRFAAWIAPAGLVHTTRVGAIVHALSGVACGVGTPAVGIAGAPKAVASVSVANVIRRVTGDAVELFIEGVGGEAAEGWPTKGRRGGG
jgi:hypothetical protein